ncbi:hypothetical protein EYC95_20290 [Pseudomonas sp. BGI-2]|nr:hypothetical protein EYC95_20290 [Pseudomonas sp. BGI-2]
METSVTVCLLGGGKSLLAGEEYRRGMLRQPNGLARRPSCGIREQARSHRGSPPITKFVYGADLLWKRACSRRGRYSQQTT